MKFYFSTKSIPGIGHLPLTQRMTHLEQAAKKLSIPEKTLLNVLKLLVIVPVFALVLRVGQDWTVLLWALAIFLLYPLLVKPMQYSLSAKYLEDVNEDDNQ
ncbi:DUF6170 family protein [Aestuariibacter salexigens]|uniref:DUF6170 family protein n=1 Tax=Aestuariibacter salexigens TaxID=226010 RepID=UPI00041AAFB8|nr:DUF6170 family protein [Aestuariibacter salexigens]